MARVRGLADDDLGAHHARRRVRAAPASSIEPAAPGTRVREVHPWRIAALFVAPYLLLSLCWAFSNPPGAAPDEKDHLVKALGTASGQLGHSIAMPQPGGPLVQERNASITRVYRIPADLVPTGYSCFAFNTLQTAACQPSLPSSPPSGSTPAEASIGAYPPFVYYPIGLAALRTDNPPHAFLAGRLVVSLCSAVLLLLGVAHLVRWLGRRAVLGYVALLTPSAVFLSGSIAPSAIELASAAGVGAVLAVALFAPDSILVPSTHWTLGVVGAVLAMGRQLGVVFLALFLVVLLFVVGWARLRRLLAMRPVSLVAAAVMVLAATAAVVWWERTYDHPAHLGPPFDTAAIHPFLTIAHPVVNSAIGTFGWLDTFMPESTVYLWLALWAVALVGGLVVGPMRVRIVIVTLVVATVVLAFVIYATGFYPVQAGIQGRHITPILAPALVVGGAALTRPARRPGLSGVPRISLVITAGVAACVLWFAVYVNGRRYAVGADGPWRWVPDAQWTPWPDWTLWLVLAAGGSVALLVVTLFLDRSATWGDRLPPAHRSARTAWPEGLRRSASAH